MCVKEDSRRQKRGNDKRKPAQEIPQRFISPESGEEREGGREGERERGREGERKRGRKRGWQHCATLLQAATSPVQIASSQLRLHVKVCCQYTTSKEHISYPCVCM